MKVLIVEDEALIAAYLETLIVGFGHEVCAIAASATEAVESAARHLPDVALMDIRLAHGSSGIDAARELHTRQGLRCIFLSANLDDDVRQKLAGCEPIGFVNKPVLPTVLRRALQTAEQQMQNLQALNIRPGTEGTEGGSPRTTPPRRRTMASTVDSRRETVSLIGSDKVDGTAVYGADEKKIGSIQRVMIDKISGKVAYAVVSFGGFLGMGEDYYPMPWTNLKYDTRLGGYRTGVTEQQLKGAPKFTRSTDWDWNDRSRDRAIYDYYQTPLWY